MAGEKLLSGRGAAFEALCRMEQGAYSNIVLDHVLQKCGSREKQFASALFYGVLERKIVLDKAIAAYLKKGTAALDPEVLAALEMGFYQLLYMENVPDRAAVGESVELIKRSRKKSAAGLVNGVLRAFLRDGKALPVRKGLSAPKEDRLEKLEWETAMPRWILGLWEEQYGPEDAEALARACLGRPPLQLRVNTVKTTAEKLTALLKEAGASAVQHPLLPNCLTVEHLGSVAALPAYQQGLCYVQDAASQLCAEAVAPRPGERVFDLCAAPGSKSFTMAQLMKNEGEILSFDLHTQRTKLIREGAERLGLTIVKAAQGDAAIHNEQLGLADRVLCDVPCSGLGVIRRKPEIRLKTPEELKGLPEIQRKILLNAADYVKPGGVLVYSTCSLNKQENDDVADAFLTARPDFVPDPLPDLLTGLTAEGAKATLMPHKGDYDGFFVARFRRSRISNRMGDELHQH